MKDILLGKKVAVPRTYDPSILYALPRTRSEAVLHGFDLWRCYELSWLNERGKPEVAILEVIYPVQSRNIVESKSLKLYLGSLSNASFSTREEVGSVIRRDLEKLLCTPWIDISILKIGDKADISRESNFPGICIDDLDIGIRSCTVDPSLLCTQKDAGRESLYSHLFKSYCPITRQPDWASIFIEYGGRKVDRRTLLAYLCSYRDHEGFAEDCCERIFLDFLSRCAPEELLVGCFYTRRGGIDINPVRCLYEIDPEKMRKYHLVRQ